MRVSFAPKHMFAYCSYGKLWPGLCFARSQSYNHTLMIIELSMLTPYGTRILLFMANRSIFKTLLCKWFQCQILWIISSRCTINNNVNYKDAIRRILQKKTQGHANKYSRGVKVTGHYWNLLKINVMHETYTW